MEGLNRTGYFGDLICWGGWSDRKTNRVDGKRQPPLGLGFASRFPIRRVKRDHLLRGLVGGRYAATSRVAAQFDGPSVREHVASCLGQGDDQVRTEPLLTSWN